MNIKTLHIPGDLLLVAGSLFIWGIGEGMFTYFQPIYLQQFGADPIVIGGILSAVGISMTVAQAPAGYLSDRIGARPVMWASWILGTLAAMIMALSGSLPFFIIGMLVYGLTSFVVAPMNAYLTAVRGDWSIERSLTIPSSMFNFGMVIGPFVGGVIGEMYGIRLIYAISTGLFVLSTIVILFARPAPIDIHHESTSSRPQLLNNPRFLVLLGVIALTTFATYLPQPFTPSFLQNQVHLPLKTIGQLGSLGSLGNTLIVLFMGSLRAPVGFMIGQILVGLFTLFMWQGTGVGWFAIGYFFIGGYRLLRSMALAYARYFIRASETGLAFGLIETANSSTIILAPILAGVLYEADPRSIYMISLGVIVLVFIINLVARNFIALTDDLSIPLPESPAAVESKVDV
jgi:MFS family permease